ncbi:serine hydrolase domain-containing protein [Phenylobacterium sp.]|uniref:serine hydrolase domain-containing protein n=1 Tax=Phenylobacterium sp. TaxID=1871053 RepID=UPI00286DE9B8|nr:serine hydrolase domain-containing protein [Phenylobacterium sp.]
MDQNRRALLAAAAGLGLTSPALAAPRGCKGRRAYAGPPLRAPLGEAVFQAATRAGAVPLVPTANADLSARFVEAAGRMKTRALTAAVASADGALWAQTRADDAPDRFFWASVGKAYTATAVLQMVEEGKLSLEATLDRWAPGVANAPWITVGDLLAHTGGLYSFQGDPGLRERPGYKSPDQLLAAAAGHPPAFCPGQAWGYSNTGYVHLGRIIEAVDGTSYAQALTRRIVARLELAETDLIAPGRIPPGLARPTADAATAGGTADNLATPYAAAGVAASASDVVRFWRALMANALHGEAMTRRRFARLIPMTGVGPAFYGLGVMVSDLAAFDRRATDTWLGHAGGLPGASAVVAYSREKTAFVAVALTGSGSPEATANLLLAGLPDAT